MRLIYLAGRELTYTRNDVLFRAFRQFSEVDVFCNQLRPKSLLVNSLMLSMKVLPRLLSGRYDMVFVGFYGHFLMFPSRLFGRKPILFDAFVSTFDTLKSNNLEFSDKSIPGRLSYMLDKNACELADHILLDTQLHVNYFVDTFNLSLNRFSVIPVGCNEDLFHPQPKQEISDPIRVLYYSSYLPIHGVDVIVKAADQLRNESIKFRLIGNGIEYQRVQQLAKDLAIDNVEFSPVIPIEALPREIANTDICLGGHFGLNNKAGRVIPGKIYQILAMGKPLIAGDTPANRDLLTHNKTAYLCQPGDSNSLAEAIIAVKNDISLRNRLAKAGLELYQDQCSEAVIKEKLYRITEQVLNKK